MKKLALLIILLLAVKGYSQHTELLDKNWYLHFGILEHEEFYPPSMIQGTVFFEDLSVIVYHSLCEDGIMANIEYDVNQEIFNIEDVPLVIVGICSEETYLDFMSNHYRIYYNQDHTSKNPFTYIIETDGDNYMLTIENGNGDIAVYGNVPLSTEDFNDLSVSIYPNPVKELLFIESKENISSITIFDIHGKKVKTVNAQSEINLSGLQSGVYFVSITSENGGIWTEKIVKK
jgi:hypothetical protein